MPYYNYMLMCDLQLYIFSVDELIYKVKFFLWEKSKLYTALMVGSNCLFIKKVWLAYVHVDRKLPNSKNPLERN